MPLTLVSEEKIVKEMLLENAFNGAFFGIMLIIILYHLLLYAAVRNQDYIYLSLLILAQIMFHMLLTGMHIQFIPFHDKKNLILFDGLIIPTGLTMVALTYSYLLDLKKNLRSFLLIFKINIIMVILLSVFYYLHPLNYVVMYRYIAIGGFFLLLLIATIIRLMQGLRIATYLLFITLIEIVSGLISIAYISGIIPLDWFSDHVHPLGNIAQVIILSFTIGMRVRRMEEERALAQALSIETMERAERIKDEFLANTSHELKTPLHGIVGISEVMLKSGKEKLSAAARENLSLIATSGRRLLSLVNDILDFSSIRHGNPAIMIKPVDLRTVISVVFSLLSPLMAGKALELRNRIPAHFLPVLADEERLRQILINLVGNAIKFTGYGVIEISAAVRETGYAEISIRDTGPGINPEEITRIFESFEQGDGSTSRTHGGAGLGLAITKKLVELQGGAIRVDSAPGRGTTLIFTLPLAEARTDASDAANATFPETSPGPAKSDSVPLQEHHLHAFMSDMPSILVVDDDPLSAKVLFDYLSDLGYRVDSVPDGSTALTKIWEKRIDLLLLDVMMPGLSGYEVLKEIRKQRSSEELPVIMITVKSQLDDIKLGFDLGANDYIMKPFQLEEITHRIENLLSPKNGGVQREPALLVHKKGMSLLIPHRDIVYLSSSGKKTVIHTDERDHEVSLLLKELELKLPRTFIRINRQLIVNSASISKVVHASNNRTMVILNDNTTRLTVGRTYIQTLRDQLEKRAST